MSNVANELLKKIKANRPKTLSEEDYLGTIPKGDMIKGFLESLLGRPIEKDEEGEIIPDIQMLALYGEWGSGKTSLMKYIQSKLDKDNSFKTVFFEAWKMEKDDNLALSLLEAIIESEDGIDKTDIKGALLAIGKGIGKGLSAKIGPINVNFKEVIQSVDDYNKNLTDDSSLKRINDFKMKYTELEDAILEKTNCKKLLVFIDDLDRCEPENVLNLLAAIKLFFTLGHRTIFICGLDEKAVDEAVKVKYNEVVKSGEYMEKIFDISFDMPKPDINKMIAYYFDDAKFNSILRSGAKIKDTIVPDYAEVVTGVQKFFEAMHFTNPRKVKKVLNKYLLIRYYKEFGLDKDTLIPDQNIEFFRYLTLFIIILYKFYQEQFYILKDYNNKIKRIENGGFYSILEERNLANIQLSIKNIFETANQKWLNRIWETATVDSSNFSLQRTKADTKRKNEIEMRTCLFDLAIFNMFAPISESTYQFDNNNINQYMEQFLTDTTAVGLFSKYIYEHLYMVRKDKDLDKEHYPLWSIFDMAELYL